MPRKLIKKYMPDPHKLREHPSLGWLGDHLNNPNLWHLTRKSVSRAFMIGLFCAFLPIPGQMLIAALLALSLAGNLAVSIGLVWLTNPLTMPAIFYFTYRIGAWLLDTQTQAPIEFHWDLATLQSEINAIWWPLLLGSVLTGILLSLLSYVAIQWFWIWHVNRSWRQRRDDRSTRDRSKPPS